MSEDNAPHPMPHHAALSARQAADMLGIHEKTVRRWIERGKLGAVKDAAGAFQIDPDDVDRLRAAGAADTPHPGAAPAANMPQDNAALAADRAAPYAAPSIDLQPLADLIERQGQEIRRLTEAATIWQMRAITLEDKLRQLTTGPITAPESPQTHTTAPGRTIAPSLSDESNEAPSRVRRGGLAALWDWLTGR